MDADEARLVGWRLRRIRDDREKSLRVIAGLAKMSTTTLWRIENGQRAPNLSEIVALATALEVPPSELTPLPVPAPANGHTDSTTEAIRLALDAVEAQEPGGMVLPLEVLRDQVTRIHAQRRACRFAEVATDLPGLIRNLHTTLATGLYHRELVDLAVYLHVHVTRLWLVHAGAPTDLVRRSVFLTQRLAQEVNEVTTLALAGFGVVDVLLHGGAFELGQTKLDALTLPPTTAGTAGLAAELAGMRAQAAVLVGRPDDAVAPMDVAGELAERFGAAGEVDSLGFVFGPTHLAIYRMWLALEADEPDRAVSVAQGVDPRPAFPVNQAQFWIHNGRALAQLRGRRDDAVGALRMAEAVFPTKFRRDPIVREVIATLLPGARQDATGMELRAMAHRVGLPV